MRRRIIATMAVLALAGGGAAVAFARGPDERPDSAEIRTATIERTTLEAGMVLTGTLTHGDPVPLEGVTGVVTALPEPGATIAAGSVVLEVSGQPVFFLHGAVPLWRPLALNDPGKDVLALKSGLAEVGLDVGDPADPVFDASTSAAIDQLFQNAGYDPPRKTSEGIERTAAAQAQLDAAQGVLAAAQSALSEATTPPSAVETAQADVAVAAAKKAFEDAAAEQSGDLAVAEAEYHAAVAARQTLDVPPEVAAEERAVADAQAQVDAARGGLAVASANWVAPTMIVIVPEPAVTVASVDARVGGSASGTVLTWTGTTVYARAVVTASQQAALVPGGAVTVTLPDGATTPGTITEIVASVAEGQASEAQGPTSGGPTVTVEIPDQEAMAGAGAAAVRIDVETQSAADVLVVPVTALVALAEGGYAVEKVTGGKEGAPVTRYVAVEVGLVAEARVQITSTELDEGDEVVIP